METELAKTILEILKNGGQTGTLILLFIGYQYWKKKTGAGVDHSKLADTIIGKIGKNGNSHGCYQEKKLSEIESGIQGVRSEFGMMRELTTLVSKQVDGLQKSHSETKGLLNTAITYFKER